MILAIDFDGTITDNDYEYPAIGNVKEDAIQYINKLYDEGHQIIIWTCRSGDHVQMVKECLEKNNIKYHRINENCPVIRGNFTDDCRKIFADIYIDDRGILGIPRWELIYEIVKEKEPILV